MKACEACHVKVQSKKDFCPLCGSPLAASGEAGFAAPRNAYPDLSRRMVQYNFFLRLSLFVSLLAGGISLLVNLLVTPQLLWSLIVIASLAYCWVVIPPLLRRGVNFAAQAVLQVLFTSTLVIILDFITGYRGWSLTYVVPGLLMAGIIAIGFMVMFNRTKWSQYVLYQIVMGIFGFIPLVLYFFNLSANLLMVILTGAFAMASLLVTFIFGDRTVKNEFKRRFHL